MKKSMSIILTILIGLTGSVMAQNNHMLAMTAEVPSSAYAVLNVSEAIHDFGDVALGVPVEHTFEILNEGDAPLFLTKVQSSCGCTATEYSKEAIAPGEAGFVNAKYNASKAGNFNKSVKVFSNGGEITLFVKGEVLQEN